MYYQQGGYPKGYSLKKPQGRNNKRTERIFTEVLPDGSTSGNYIGYDYKRPNGTWQGTSWVSAVKKVYRQYCTEFRQEFIKFRASGSGSNGGNGGSGSNGKDDFDQVWKKLTPEEKLRLKSEASELKCDPVEITLREITPGNNKIDFSSRERKYYVESIPITPKKVEPSTGISPRVYRFVPKVYPMKKR